MFALVCGCILVASQAFVPRIALIGKDARKLEFAKYYGELFRLPVVNPWSPIPYNGYVVVAEQATDLDYYLDENIQVVDMDHEWSWKEKAPNYFVSWVLQKLV